MAERRHLVLDADVEEILVQFGLMESSDSERGSRQISRSLVSSSGSYNSSSDFSQSIIPASSPEKIEMMTIPYAVESEDSYMFMGFDSTTAHMLFNTFQSQSDPDWQESFLSLAESFVKSKTDTDSMDDTKWINCFSELGIKEEQQQLFLEPSFSDVRTSRSCHFWVLENLFARHHFLQKLNTNIRAGMLREHTSQQPGTYEQAGSTSSPPTSPTPTSRKSMDQSTDQASSSAVTPAPATQERHITPVYRDGHTRLFHAGHHAKHLDFVATSQEQCLKWSAFASPAGDFSPQQSAYFTPQHETAEKYMRYHQHYYENSELSMLEIDVPFELVEDLQKEYIMSDGDDQGEKWRQLVFRSRRAERPPKSLRYLRSKDLLIGHIATGTNDEDAALLSPDQILAKKVMKIHSRFHTQSTQQHGQQATIINALQWVFNTDHAQDRVEEQCWNKVEILSIKDYGAKYEQLSGSQQ